MFEKPNFTAPPKTTCVSCGAPSAWLCQGCRRWYCKKCAPNGLCPTHFGMLDAEDREAVSRVMGLISNRNNKKIIVIIIVIVPVLIGIFAFTWLFPTNADWYWYWIVILAILFGALILPFLIILYPLRKDIPRLKGMAQKYNFSGSTGAASPHFDHYETSTAIKNNFGEKFNTEPPNSGNSPTVVPSSLTSLRIVGIFFGLLVIISVIVVVYLV